MWKNVKKCLLINVHFSTEKERARNNFTKKSELTTTTMTTMMEKPTIKQMSWDLRLFFCIPFSILFAISFRPLANYE